MARYSMMNTKSHGMHCDAGSTVISVLVLVAIEVLSLFAETLELKNNVYVVYIFVSETHHFGIFPWNIFNVR